MARDFNHQLTDDSKEHWLTPPEIIRALGDFDLDPCCPENMPWQTATYMNKKSMADGLAMEWPDRSRVWLNPPYGSETFKWLEKLSAHPGGGTALIFARTETKGFHRQIWDKAFGIFFFEGRICFYHADGRKGGTSNAPSCLVSYGWFDNERIKYAAKAGLIKGRFIELGSLF